MMTNGIRWDMKQYPFQILEVRRELDFDTQHIQKFKRVPCSKTPFEPRYFIQYMVVQVNLSPFDWLIDTITFYTFSA